MQKEKIIKSVSDETFFDSNEIYLDRESLVFKENVEKIARFMSANILLSTPECIYLYRQFPPTTPTTKIFWRKNTPQHLLLLARKHWHRLAAC